MENLEDNKEKILENALTLFSEKGYDAVSVQTLCEKSEITKPTLYYYFGNKSGVLNEVLKVNYDKLNTLIKENSKYTPNINDYEKDVYQVLLNLTKCYFSFAKNNDKFYRMVLQALCAPQDSELYNLVKNLNQTQYEIIENMFAEMADTHQNMKRHEKRLAWTFIGMINTYILLDAKSNNKEIVHQFMHGIFS